LSPALSLGVLGYLSLNEPQGNPNAITEQVEDLYGLAIRRLADEYARGAVCIAINYDPSTRRDIGDLQKVLEVRGNESVPVHPEALRSVGIEDRESRVTSCPHGWGNDVVLVGNIEPIKALAFPTREYLKANKQIGYPGADVASLDHAFGVSFVTNSVLSTREMQVVMLRAAIPSDKFPNHVVEGTPQIVDSVAYVTEKVLGIGFSNLIWIDG
jgi:hypothetical protein